MSEKMNKLPAGWDEAQIRELAAHYDNQTEDEQVAEIEAALVADGITMMAVPSELEDDVRALISRNRTGSKHDMPT